MCARKVWTLQEILAKIIQNITKDRCFWAGKLLLLLTVACLLCSGSAELGEGPRMGEEYWLSAGWQQQSSYTLSGYGAAEVRELTRPEQGESLQRRIYDFADGSLFLQQRSIYSGAVAADLLLELPLDAQSLRLRYYDGAAWQNVNCLPEQLPLTTLFFDLTLNDGSRQQLIVSPVYAYETRENASLRWREDWCGTLQLLREESGYVLRIYSGTAEAHRCEFWLLRGVELVDWQAADAEALWARCALADSNRWCWDGYYYSTPSTYLPYGEDYFYSMPSPYIAAHLLQADQPGAAELLPLVMLDVMRGRLNEQGFVPMSTVSTWLHEAYGIGKNYYDTRWNTDLAESWLLAYQRLGVTELLDAAVRYADFLTSYAEAHHFTVGERGWLVYDYWQEGADNANHCSLNHQAAEAVFLYRIYRETGAEEYATCADALLMGIGSSLELWRRADKDLNYALTPELQVVGTDYPYLTYNDLLALQAELVEVLGAESAGINTLLGDKLIWMQRNGVTGYKGYSAE